MSSGNKDVRKNISSVYVAKYYDERTNVSQPYNQSTQTASLLGSIDLVSKTGASSVPDSSGWRKPTSYAFRAVTGDYFSTTVFGHKRTRDLTPGPNGYITVDVRYSGGFSCPSGPPLPSSSGLQSQAEIQALLRLKDQKANIAQDLAETGKNIKMISSTALRLVDALRALRRGDFASVARALGVRSFRDTHGSIAEQWLAWQYGWRPLIEDADYVFQKYIAKDKKYPDRNVATVTGRASTSGHVTQVGIGTASYSPYSMTFDRVIDWKVGAFVRLDYVLRNRLAADASALGFVNLIDLAWELVPFSFVADWFLPIGDYLSALDAANGWQFKGGSVSILTEQVGEWKAHWIPTTGHTIEAQTISSPGRWRQVFLNRNVYANSPWPKAPLYFKDGLSLGHLANAIALVRMAFR